MKSKLPFILFLAASLTACTTTVKTTQSTDPKSAAYTSNLEASMPGEEQEIDIPAEGPAPGNLGDNPAYFPSPLLRQSAAGSP